VRHDHAEVGLGHDQRPDDREPRGRAAAHLHLPLSNTATAGLLWAASRPELDRELVEAALLRGPDLPRAATLAIEQRVSPLVLRALDALEVDGPWAADLRADAARCRAQAALVLPALAERGLRPLVRAGLAPVVMKGAALVDRYPKVGLRPMDDVDVLVADGAVEEAVQVLERAGWIRRPVPGAEHHEVVVTHPEVPGLPLEVHGSFATRRQMSNRLDAAELWGRRIACDVGGAEVARFCPEDEVVFVAAHAAKPFHVFMRLLWAVDVAVIVLAADREGAPIDWHRVGVVCRSAACRTAVAVALTQAARLGARVPESLCTSPAAKTRRAALAPVLSAEWPEVPRDEGVRDRLRYALVDDPRLWVVLLAEAGRLRSPGEVARTASRVVRRVRRLRHGGEEVAEEPGDGVEP
jgi:hypothetical protein